MNARTTPGPPGILQTILASRTECLVLAGLVAYPWVASPFFVFQIGAQALVLGTIALSLSLLVTYGGMVSLSQMTIAGIAGYTLAIVGTTGISLPIRQLGWAWYWAIPIAISIAILAAGGIGWLAARTEGIYTLMITLASGIAFHYLAQQNYTFFNGFQGLSGINPPLYPLEHDWRTPVSFYYLSLATAVLCTALILYGRNTPFGLVLQGIRDNPLRMQALGFNVTAHRVVAQMVAGGIAALGGILWVWYHGRISPSSVGAGAMINILIIAVLGGLRHPTGAYWGALLYVLIQSFAIDWVDRERFNLVIGGIFLVIVMLSPDGLVGLWRAVCKTTEKPPPSHT